jgi:hypothetical protein
VADQPLTHPARRPQIQLVGCLGVTNFIVEHCTASAMASASRKSFLPVFEYGRTHFAGTNRAL